MATITTGGSGNWSSTTNNAPWPSGTKPTTGDVVVIATGHTVTLDENTAALGAAGISGSGTAVLDISGTRTINGCVSYSGTATSGFVTLGTGDDLTITYGGGAGTSAVSNSSSGYCVVAGGSGVLTVSNTGGVAAQNTSSGRTISHGSTGNLTITGSLQSPSSGRRCVVVSAAATVSITGDVLNSVGNTETATLDVSAGTVTIDGKLGGSATIGFALYMAGGTVNWTGNRSLAASEDLFIYIQSGTLNLALAGSRLVHTNSGSFVIRRGSGTLNMADAGAGAASITNYTATSYAAIINGTDVQKALIVGPTIPAEADVETGVNYGYAGDVQTGTLAAGGGGGGGPLIGGRLVQ